MIIKKVIIYVVLLCSLFQLRAQSSRYTESSVLSRGDWYKIQVDKTGIYKLTYEQLVDMGVKNPANVSVYGYGGAQLPESFLEPYIDDLPQLSIYMEKGSDGVFNAGDYILFYAQGPIKWEYNEKQMMFEHVVNTYSNYGYYFITSDVGSLKLIEKSTELEGADLLEITSFDDYYLYEKDEISLLNSGRIFLCDQFNQSQLSRNYTIKVPNILKETAILKVDAAHVAVVEARMKVEVDNEVLGNLIFSKRLGNENVATAANKKFEFIPKSNNEIRLNLVYNNSSSSAYLDFFTLNFKRKLQKIGNSYLQFRFVDNIGYGNCLYKLSNANANVQIWNVTDPQNIVSMVTDLSGTDMTFVDNNRVLKEYVAVDVKSDNFLEPSVIGKIANQDLHSLGQVDMLIISHSDFVDASRRLADFHAEYDGLTTHIVTPDVIYNEFSSGTPDATAYRRFAKMFYDRAKDVGNAPKYMLLFGDGSFDNRQILKANTDKNIYRLLTYQAKESFDDVDSYTTDDYFGFLDDNEGLYLSMNDLDISIGRIPVYTIEQANGVVDKLGRYIKNEDLGAWKNQAIFLADDGDKNLHVKECDSVCTVFEESNPSFLTRKLYLESYTQEVTAVGEFYPTLKKELYDYINSGVLFINYMGHSGYNNWTNEQILTIADINSLYNERLPLVITASCSFSRFDDFKDSGGEVMLTNSKGGALALISATRTVLAHPNMLLNIEIAKYLLKFNEETGRINTIGEAYKLAKNRRAKNSDTNRLAFTLLGDPAIRLSVPETHEVTIDSINSKDVSIKVDTVGALGKVKLDGSVCFLNNKSIDKSFNGLIYISIFDKEEQIETLSNDANPSDSMTIYEPFTYTYRTNPLYVGQSEVKDGKFQIEFIVPKDIRYNFGEGRIVMYAMDREQGLEANGYSSQLIIGGDAKDAVLEEEGPELFIYLNTPYFKNGDIVDENPVFIAELKDQSGINTIGLGIGHDIILKIDEDSNQEYILNNYYESFVGSYTSGMINYRLFNLSEGKHKLFFRAWDLQNNSTSAELEFEVVAKTKVSLHNVTVYPNPVYDVATIEIEHDRPLNPFDVQLYVYDLSGHLISMTESNIVADVSGKIILDFDARPCLQDGLYFVKVVLIDQNGKKSTKTAKIFVRKQ